MQATVTRPAIDAKLISPFLASVKQVFSTMAATEITLDRPFLKAESTSATYSISGIIGFSGDIIGSMTVSFQTEAAKKLVAAFAGMEMEVETPDFADAIGELANMIAGSAKKSLGGSASITVPTVIVGPGHVIARLKDAPCVVVPCKSTAGEFTLEITLKRA